MTEVQVQGLAGSSCPCFTKAGGWEGGVGRGTREEENGKSENREGEEPERTEIRKIT